MSEYLEVRTLYSSTGTTGVTPHGVTFTAATSPDVVGQRVYLSYEILNGPSGAGVDDLYDPEVAAFTDSALGVRHDVGTIHAGSGSRLGGPLDGFDTPSLLGVWGTAPYLHDGSAATLDAAIAAHTAATAQERAELAEFLRELNQGDAQPLPEPSLPRAVLWILSPLAWLRSRRAGRPASCAQRAEGERSP